jgi:outer membrane protein assembly factor BamC
MAEARLEAPPSEDSGVFEPARPDHGLGVEEVPAFTVAKPSLKSKKPAKKGVITSSLLGVDGGVSQEQSKAVVAAASTAATNPLARMDKINGVPVLQLAEGFDRAWRRVGLALDRTGFTVEDRNRNEGTYFVRYVAPEMNKKEPGFFGKLFSGSSPTTPPLKFRIVLRSQGDATTVSVLNEAGAPESSANAERIVRVIADDLK